MSTITLTSGYPYPRLTEQYVYAAIDHARSLFKFGISVCPPARVYQLQAVAGGPLDLVGMAPTGGTVTWELMMHTDLNDSHGRPGMKREWYPFSDETRELARRIVAGHDPLPYVAGPDWLELGESGRARAAEYKKVYDAHFRRIAREQKALLIAPAGEAA